MATKKQFFYPVVIFFVLGGIAATLMNNEKEPEEKQQEQAIPVVTVTDVNLDTIDLKVDSQGVVNARYETRLVAQVSGEIVELSEQFVRGGFVKKGQLLARIDPSDYAAALIEAQANLASASAALEIEQAAGHVAKEEWKNVSSTAPSDLGLRRPQLKQEQARVKAATAAVKRAERNLERTQIIAPFDALIDSRHIGLGSFVGAGSELGKVYNTALAEVRLPIPTNQLQYLENFGVGAIVDLHGAFAGKQVIWQARIARSEGVIDEQSRMTYLVAEVDAPYNNPAYEYALRFGTYVTAKVHGISLPNSAVVSQHLIRRGKVAVLDNDDKLRFKTVVVGREQNRDAVVTEGLATGDRIITSAMDYPVDGMQLTTESALDSNNGSDGDAAVEETQIAMQE